MYRYNIYVGMFDKDTKQQELSTTKFLNTVRKVMRYNFVDNYTIIKCKGHYKSETMTVCEPSIIIDIVIDYELDTTFLKNQLCRFLNQESVFVTRQDVQVL